MSRFARIGGSMHEDDASPAAILVTVWSMGTPLGLPMDGSVLHRGLRAVHERLPVVLRDALEFTEDADGIECTTLPELIEEAETTGLVRRAGIGPISCVVEMTDARVDRVLEAVRIDRTQAKGLGRALFDACCTGVPRSRTSDQTGDVA